MILFTNNYFHSSISTFSFRRQLLLPLTADDSNACASLLTDGYE